LKDWQLEVGADEDLDTMSREQEDSGALAMV